MKIPSRKQAFQDGLRLIIPVRSWPTPHRRSDAEALASDWGNVRQDLRKAVRIHKSKLQP